MIQLDLTCFCCLRSAAPPPSPWDCHCGPLPHPGGTRWSPALCPLGQMEGKGDWIPLPTHTHIQVPRDSAEGGGCRSVGPYEPITERGRISTLRWGEGRLNYPPPHTHTTYPFSSKGVNGTLTLRTLAPKGIFGSRFERSRDRLLKSQKALRPLLQLVGLPFLGKPGRDSADAVGGGSKWAGPRSEGW